MTTVIVDYESGNLHSAEKAFQLMAAETDAGKVVVTDDPDQVRRASRVVLPGDGAFPACKRALFEHSGLFEAIEEAVVRDAKPFLGICIGMQMMATLGLEYEPTEGFGWIEGTVQPIEPSDRHLKVPHMGWNDLAIDRPHALLDGVSSGDHAYFVHSYHVEVKDPADRIAHVDYGQELTAIIGRGTMIGTQFHPEKSQATGLKIISNFLTWSP